MILVEESHLPTPYAVRCRGAVYGERCNDGKIIFITKRSYDSQMWSPDTLWKCPRCHGNATWDDDNYERAMEMEEPR